MFFVCGRVEVRGRLLSVGREDQMGIRGRATYNGTSGFIIKLGVMIAKGLMMGFVSLTNILMKKNSESSLWKTFIAVLPMSVHMIIPIT